MYLQCIYDVLPMQRTKRCRALASEVCTTEIMETRILTVSGSSGYDYVEFPIIKQVIFNKECLDTTRTTQRAE